MPFQDGNDFFDIAADRFRCFDPLTIDCTTAMILEALAIVTVGIIVMATIHYLYKAYKIFRGVPDCIDIEISVDEVKEDLEVKPV